VFTNFKTVSYEFPITGSTTTVSEVDPN